MKIIRSTATRLSEALAWGPSQAIKYRNFDEEDYLTRYPDVRAAISQGKMPSARYHFIKYGQAEGRTAIFGRQGDSLICKPVEKGAGAQSVTAAAASRDAFLGDLGGKIAAGPGKIVRQLATGRGDDIIKLSRSIVDASKEASVERYGRAAQDPAATLITCLYGWPQLLPVQVSLLSASRLIDQVEIVYVNNSPELADVVNAEARQAARLCGVPITVVTPRGNLGFGAANNLGAKHARAPRLIIINPDVFPKDNDWLVAHNAFAASENGKCFGACLYYDDGSVMHAGMQLQKDTYFDKADDPVELLRVDHFAKGFPDWAPEARTTRIVPAVTGAFISIDRAHYENLGGFDEDFIFGHYEDADLCLRSAQAGVPVWYCAEVKLWHMEGKGSTWRAEHAGASQVNRWLFTKKWRDNPVAAVTQ